MSQNIVSDVLAEIVKHHMIACATNATDIQRGLSVYFKLN